MLRGRSGYTTRSARDGITILWCLGVPNLGRPLALTVPVASAEMVEPRSQRGTRRGTAPASPRDTTGIEDTRIAGRVEPELGLRLASAPGERARSTGCDWKG